MSELTRDELLIVLIEECGEVIQAATKCLRFGWDRDHPGYGINCDVLAKEVGDMQGILAGLPLREDLVKMFRDMKMRKAERYKTQYGNR